VLQNLNAAFVVVVVFFFFFFIGLFRERRRTQTCTACTTMAARKNKRAYSTSDYDLQTTSSWMKNPRRNLSCLIIGIVWRGVVGGGGGERKSSGFCIQAARILDVLL
jgi:hypothetical protein